MPGDRLRPMAGLLPAPYFLYRDEHGEANLHPGRTLPWDGGEFLGGRARGSQHLAHQQQGDADTTGDDPANCPEGKTPQTVCYNLPNGDTVCKTMCV